MKLRTSFNLSFTFFICKTVIKWYLIHRITRRIKWISSNAWHIVFWKDKLSLLNFLIIYILILLNDTAAAAKSLQSCPTLCDPIDGSPPGSPISGILQARTLEWVAISFSNAWKWKVKVKSLSRFWLLATPWTAAHQAPPSMGFSRQEYWSGVPLPSPIKWY